MRSRNREIILHNTLDNKICPKFVAKYGKYYNNLNKIGLHIKLSYTQMLIEYIIKLKVCFAANL